MENLHIPTKISSRVPMHLGARSFFLLTRAGKTKIVVVLIGLWASNVYSDY